MFLISVSNEQFSKNIYTITFQVKSVYMSKIIKSFKFNTIFFDRQFTAIIANIIMKQMMIR